MNDWINLKTTADMSRSASPYVSCGKTDLTIPHRVHDVHEVSDKILFAVFDPFFVEALLIWKL